MSPRGAWSDAEWSAVDSLLAAYWPAEPLTAATQRLWRRSLERFHAGQVIDALDELCRRTQRPSLADIVAAAGRVPVDAKRAG